jgi:hypothetical protein
MGIWGVYALQNDSDMDVLDDVRFEKKRIDEKLIKKLLNGGDEFEWFLGACLVASSMHGIEKVFVGPGVISTMLKKNDRITAYDDIIKPITNMSHLKQDAISACDKCLEEAQYWEGNEEKRMTAINNIKDLLNA